MVWILRRGWIEWKHNYGKPCSFVENDCYHAYYYNSHPKALSELLTSVKCLQRLIDDVIELAEKEKVKYYNNSHCSSCNACHVVIIKVVQLADYQLQDVNLEQSSP